MVAGPGKMENVKSPLDEALDIVLKLPLKERLQLIEQAVSSIKRDIELTPAETEPQASEHWGKSLNALMDEIGPIEMAYPEITDPVEWVEQIRRDDASTRALDWGEYA